MPPPIMKDVRWAILVGGLGCVLALWILAVSQSPGNWSFRNQAGGNWHLETGYLLDNAALFELSADAYPTPQGFISGRFYRFGPVAVYHLWRSQVAVTNVFALPGPKRLL